MSEKKSFFVSLRNLAVDYAESRKALVDFFKEYKVCPRCKGKGYIEKTDKLEEVYRQPMRLKIDHIKNLMFMHDKVDNMSEIVKDAIYKKKGYRKTCPKCHGEKFVERPTRPKS